MAQCAMCKKVAESNMENNDNKVGRSLNSGILYMMALPYIIGGVYGVVWYKNRKKKSNEEE